MAYFMSRKASSGGGGGLSYTTLWTNPDPTAEFGRSGGVSVSLSDDIDNYQFLEFTFQKTTSNTDKYSILIPVSEFKLSSSGAGAGKVKYAANVATATYWTFFRAFWYNSDTEVLIDQCAFYRANSATTYQNQYVIPYTIKGVTA